MPLTTRPATLADIDRLAEVKIASWRAGYVGQVPDDYLADMDLDENREKWLRNLTELAQWRRVLVATTVPAIGDSDRPDDDPLVVAYCVAGPYRVQQDAEPEDVSGLGEILSIYTDPAYQGVGAGTLLLDVQMRWLHEQGFTAAALWVLESNIASIGWYERRGWRPDGARSTWSGTGVPLSEIRLRRTLP